MGKTGRPYAPKYREEAVRLWSRYWWSVAPNCTAQASR
jgi:hypothetical protein